jgi:alpha-L-fucosidase 2
VVSKVSNDLINIRLKAYRKRGISGLTVWILVAAYCLVPSAEAVVNDNSLILWYDQPASDWEREGLPIGNGALGAVIQGGVNLDIIQFNEKTLWTGGPGSSEGYDFGIPKESSLKTLRQVQEQLAQKGSMEPEAVAKLLGHQAIGYGNYQSFGDLELAFSHGEIKNYKRELDISRAIARVSYTADGILYSREYFASHPDNFLVIRLTADQPGHIDFSANIKIPDNRSVKTRLKNGRFTVAGELKDNRLRYEAQLQILAEGGQRKDSKNSITVANADSAWIVLTAATNYAQNYPRYRGKNPHADVQARIDRAANKGYAKLLAAHNADYRALFDRVTLDIGQQMPGQTTNRLLELYKGDSDSAAKRALEALYFQYGRYLLIASSRAGSLPANLQGVWNHSATPPWNADYHVNINLQMNYWPAEQTNLAETAVPLFQFIDSLVEPGRQSAKTILDADGWTLFLNTNIWGFTGVIDWPTAFWQPEAAAWLAQHYYEHYLFSADAEFLRQRAYPIMKEAARVWLQALYHDPASGQLLVSPSYSPEHGPFVMGAAMSQQIVFDLLRNTRDAAHRLGDSLFQTELETALDKIDPGIRTGSWGQLQEWRQDIDDPNNQHRHVSHLFALHPGSRISPITTPELADAARKSLNARGDGGTGWSKAWKINLWARLLDGDHAHRLLVEQLRESTLPNLWDTHPPFQIDGNFGATAGIAEMLLQSQDSAVHLLPALPVAWPEGEVKGLRARGDITVSMQWSGNSLKQSTLLSGQSGPITLRTGLLKQKYNFLEVSSGRPVELKLNGQQATFMAKAGESYLLSVMTD